VCQLDWTKNGTNSWGRRRKFDRGSAQGAKTDDIKHILKVRFLCVFFILLTERTSEIRIVVYVFHLLRLFSSEKLWTRRRETSKEHLKGKKGKVVPAHVIKACTGVEVQLHSVLMLVQNWGEWSASRIGRITPMERPVVLNEYKAEWAPEWVWMLWRIEKSLAQREISCTCQDSDPKSSGLSFSHYTTTEFCVPLHFSMWEVTLEMKYWRLEWV
jgi:hypothetical protein